MVLWIKKQLHKHGLNLLYALCITCVLMLPYITKDFLPIEHDTFFHVSRIEQLSKSIQSGNILPALYPYENKGYGYASPLFYCDFLMIPFALLHLSGCSLVFSYKAAVFTASFFSCLTMMHLMDTLFRRRSASWTAGAACLFANYRITDIYVRGALGEIFAFVFLPCVIEGMYRIMHEGDTKHYMYPALSLAGLCLCHNLTFLMGVFLCLILFLINLKEVTREKIIALAKAVIIAFLLSCFFTLPMLEQLAEQKYILNYYGESSDLASGAMAFWQYFVNKTVFGYSGNALPHDQTMTVNIGWFLTFAPLLWLLVKKDIRSQYAYVTKIMITGYVFMLMPCMLVPWNHLAILRIMQFPWRMNTIAMVLLTIPASASISFLITKKHIWTILPVLLSMECLFHVIPVYTRTFGLTSKTSWEDVLDGELCDPCYSAYYVRVELAGGDYLPLSSPDFRERDYVIRDEDDIPVSAEITKKDSTLSFTLSSSLKEAVLPLTYYKGYHLYQITDSGRKEIPVSKSQNGMVSAENLKAGKYICVYKNTPLRNVSIAISILCLLFCIMHSFFRK